MLETSQSLINEVYEANRLKGTVPMSLAERLITHITELNDYINQQSPLLVPGEDGSLRPATAVEAAAFHAR